MLDIRVQNLEHRRDWLWLIFNVIDGTAVAKTIPLWAGLSVTTIVDCLKINQEILSL